MHVPPQSHAGSAADPDVAVDTLGVGAMDDFASPGGLALAPRAPVRRQLGEQLPFGAMIGASPAMEKVFEQIAHVARRLTHRVVLGPAPAKELVAEAVTLVMRRPQEMIAVTRLPSRPSLIESELFGHERGSFTGADRVHRGHFERADGGTLFLDEICESRRSSGEGCGVLGSGRCTRRGASLARAGRSPGERADRRGGRDLEVAAAGGGPVGLLYRLKVIPIFLPPLHERGGDLSLLAAHFLARLERGAGETDKLPTPPGAAASRRRLAGNIRELSRPLERPTCSRPFRRRVPVCPAWTSWQRPGRPAFRPRRSLA